MTNLKTVSVCIFITYISLNFFYQVGSDSYQHKDVVACKTCSCTKLAEHDCLRCSQVKELQESLRKDKEKVKINESSSNNIPPTQVTSFQPATNLSPSLVTNSTGKCQSHSKEPNSSQPESPEQVARPLSPASLRQQRLSVLPGTFLSCHILINSHNT